MEILKLPVGIENFEDIRRSGFYYIDKTMLIEQTLNNWSKPVQGALERLLA